MRSVGDGLVATFWILLITVTGLIDGGRVRDGLRSLLPTHRRKRFERVDTIVVFAGDRSVIVGGRATVLDPARMWVPKDLLERARAVPALGRYLVDQRSLLGGFIASPIAALSARFCALIGLTPPKCW